MEIKEDFGNEERFEPFKRGSEKSHLLSARGQIVLGSDESADTNSVSDMCHFMHQFISRLIDGQSSYKAITLSEAVEQQVRLFLSKLEGVPKERFVELASARNEETYKQAQKDFENTQKQIAVLEEEAVKALTGESQLDLSVVIDSVLQEAYQVTTLMNDHMNGEFMVLKPGANVISWTEAVTKAIIQPNWRSL